MIIRFRRLVIRGTCVLALYLAMVPSTLVGAQQATPTSADAGCRTFPETGKQVCGKLLSYWDSHGGLAQQGYPISEPLQEKSDVDGKVYTVQYFERAVFELHLENKPPYDVLLSLLGSMSYKARYPGGAPDQKASTEPGAVKFPETGHTAGGKFLRYWNEHGGVAQQGFPISEEFTDVSELDGKVYTVQYFERAVFELHPENKPPYDVLLSQLGALRFRAKYPQGQPGTPLTEDIWGGNHLQLTVHQGGAELEFDCAHASVPQTLLVSNNTVDAAGTFVREHGGPIRQGEPEDSHPMRILGTLNGDTLRLTVVLLDSKQEVGTYLLTLGKQGFIVKCL